MFKSTLVNHGCIGDLASQLIENFYDKDVLDAIIEYVQTSKNETLKKDFRDLLGEIVDDYLDDELFETPREE